MRDLKGLGSIAFQMKVGIELQLSYYKVDQSSEKAIYQVKLIRDKIEGIRKDLVQVSLQNPDEQTVEECYQSNLNSLYFSSNELRQSLDAMTSFIDSSHVQDAQKNFEILTRFIIRVSNEYEGRPYTVIYKPPAE